MKKIFTVFLLAVIYFAPFSVRAESTPPSAPLNLEVINLGDLTVMLSWHPPASEGDSPVTEYNIYYIERVYGDMYVTDGPVTTFTTGRLKAGASYDFWVVAVNASGEGDISERVKVVPTEDVTGPVITVGPQVSVTDKTASVYWETDEYASTNLNFDVHGNGPHNSISIKALNLTHDVSLSGLLPCTTYFYNTVNEDSASNVTQSDMSSFKTAGCLGAILDEIESSLGLPVDPLSVNFERSGVEVSLLPDSFDLESIFQIKKLSIADVDANVGCPAGNKPIGGRIYDIKLLEEYDRQASLKKPATVTMSYDHSELSGVDESKISMFHYTEETGWVKLNSCTLDTEKDEITCETPRFSKFMISFGEEYKCKPLMKNLSFGSYHVDVFSLQEFLNKNGFMDSFVPKVYEEVEEKRLFDGKTVKALRSFQETSGITGIEKTLGFLGPKSRDFINNQNK
jgi:hypothetical protein